MTKTLQTLELLLGKPLKEATDDEILQLFFLSVRELTLIKAYKMWVGGKRFSSKKTLAMTGALYWEARRRMKIY